MKNTMRTLVGTLMFATASAFASDSQLVATVQDSTNEYFTATNNVTASTNVNSGVSDSSSNYEVFTEARAKIDAKTLVSPLEQQSNQVPLISKLTLKDGTFPVAGRQADLSITNFPHAGDWYLLVADKIDGIWKPATNQGYTSPRFGFIPGAYPFTIDDSTKAITITEYIDGKDTQFFKVTDVPILD